MDAAVVVEAEVRGLHRGPVVDVAHVGRLLLVVGVGQVPLIVAAALLVEPAPVAGVVEAHLRQVPHDVAVGLVDGAGLVLVVDALHGMLGDAVGVFMTAHVHAVAAVVGVGHREARPAVVDAVVAAVVDGGAVLVAVAHGDQDGRAEAVHGADAVVQVEVVHDDVVGIGQ